MTEGAGPKSVNSRNSNLSGLPRGHKVMSLWSLLVLLAGGDQDQSSYHQVWEISNSISVNSLQDNCSNIKH